MSSSENDRGRCDNKSCGIRQEHCHVCDSDDCEIDLPHCHVCEHEGTQKGSVATWRDLVSARNDTQPGSTKYQAMLLRQRQGAKDLSESTNSLGEDITPQVAYHSAQWQPSYAVGGGTDLTKMLRPTAHRTFSWGGRGSNVTIPSPDHSESSSTPESRGEENVKRVRRSLLS
jgi:hypothetical protein